MQQRHGGLKMLHEFLTVHNAKVVDHCQMSAAARGPPRLPSDAMRYGVPMFLGQVIDTLRSELHLGSTSDQLEYVSVRTEKPQATQGATVNELARRRYDLAWESSRSAMRARLRDLMQGLRLDIDRRETIALQKIATLTSDLDGHC